MNTFYDQLIRATIQQNRMVEEQLTIKQNNYDKLYKTTEIPFEERQLQIRWVKIPTFINENKPRYYAIFLDNIEFWRKGELKRLYQQTIESIDSQDIDSFTIFLIGRLFGFFDKMDHRPEYYHIFRINNNVFSLKERKIIVNCICNFLEKRIQEIASNGIFSVSLKKDIDRLQYFIDTFRYMRVITCARGNDSNTSIRKYEVLDNTTSNTSISNITRYNAYKENLPKLRGDGLA